MRTAANKVLSLTTDYLSIAARKTAMLRMMLGAIPWASK